MGVCHFSAVSGIEPYEGKPDVNRLIAIHKYGAY